MATHAPVPQAIPSPVSAPAVTAANRVSVTVQPTDFILSLGMTRVAFDAAGNQAGIGVEYLSSHSLSPTTAKQLSKILDLVVRKYESTWGAIPLDQASIEKLAQLESQQLLDLNPKPARKRAAAKRARAQTVKPKR